MYTLKLALLSLGLLAWLNELGATPPQADSTWMTDYEELVDYIAKAKLNSSSDSDSLLITYDQYFSLHIDDFTEGYLQNLFTISIFDSLALSNQIHTSQREILGTIASMAQGELATKIQYQLGENQASFSDHRQAIAYLTPKGYRFFTKPSNVEKTINYLLMGRFEYVFRRLTGAYLFESMVGLSVVFVGILLILFKLKFRRKHLSSFGLLVFMFSLTGSKQIAPPIWESKEIVLSEEVEAKMVDLYFEKRSKKIASVVWVPYDSVKAKYFISNHPYDRVQAWLVPELGVVASFSANYASMFRGGGAPVVSRGLTLEQGKVMNKTFDRSMDGLVLIQSEGKHQGKLVVENTGDRMYLWNEYFDFESAYGRLRFTRLVQEKGLTVFQSHLLVHSNELQFSEGVTNGRETERRFLGLVEENGRVMVVLVDIPQIHSLRYASEIMLRYFQEVRKASVIALVNLDTGAYNMLEVYNAEKDIVLNSHEDLREAANLLTLYYNR